MLRYQWVYSEWMNNYQPQYTDGAGPTLGPAPRCHYPWCGHQAQAMPALPVLTGAEPVSIKRCFWDCGTHKGGQKQLAGICHDLTVKYDYDKSVRCQIGQPYTAVVKSRCVMCSDVAEGGPQTSQAVAFFVVQWTEQCEQHGEAPDIDFSAGYCAWCSVPPQAESMEAGGSHDQSQMEATELMK